MAQQPKVKIVLIPVAEYGRKQLAEAYENAVFENHVEAQKVFGADATIYELTTFMQACNDQEINLEVHWMTYITINN